MDVVVDDDRHEWREIPAVRATATGREAFLQRGRVDFLVPLRGAFGVGVTGEYFDRRTFFQDAAKTRTKYHYPQVRAYLTWGLS